jgi:hypothetical protein
VLCRLVCEKTSGDFQVPWSFTTKYRSALSKSTLTLVKSHSDCLRVEVMKESKSAEGGSLSSFSLHFS